MLSLLSVCVGLSAVTPPGRRNAPVLRALRDPLADLINGAFHLAGASATPLVEQPFVGEDLVADGLPRSRQQDDERHARLVGGYDLRDPSALTVPNQSNARRVHGRVRLQDA